MTDQDRVPAGVDVSTPSPSRIYDYLLGGKDNFAADREAAEKILASAPEVRVAAQVNRAFLGRAVRFLVAEAGIRQFLDIGAGLPTQNNVHQAAQKVAPDARVVYVDHDPIVLAHGRALLADDERTTVIQGDMRQPEAILAHPELRSLLDLDQPVAVLMLLMLHFIPDDEDPFGVVTRLRDALAPGSYLTISHGTPDHRPGEGARQIHANAGATLRPREEILRFFDGFELVDPGLVLPTQWRPDGPDDTTNAAGGMWIFAGVGRRS